MSQPVKYFYEFGPFRLDPVERLLLRDGQYVPLTPKAFDTLMVLVKNGGHVIDKDELIKKVWPDTFVEEVNLAKNVSSLRKILGGEQSEQYIETIPKRGYRFIADVREVSDEHSKSMIAPEIAESAPIQEENERWGEQIKEGLDAGPSSSQIKPGAVLGARRFLLGRLGWLAIPLIIGFVLSIVIWWIIYRPADTTSIPHLKIVPFTSFPGRETHATFSPDGKQIAFVWDGEKGDNPDIYVKMIGAEQPLRLTSHPAADTNPAWSPDGRHIAFFRQSAESSGFYLVPALGGPERKVADVFPYRIPAGANTRYYSPDGKFLVVADKNSSEEPFSLFSISIETGEKRRITAPPPGTEGDSYPDFSPDGKTLAFIRASSRATTDLYLVSPAGGEPQRLTFDNTSIIGHSWTSDGREIVFASRRGSSIYSLWRISAAGGALERLPTIGQSVISPVISHQGDLLAYTQTLDDQNIWRIELDAAGRGIGATSLISSTLGDNGPDYSPDGRKIVFASNRSGDFGIWVCDNLGANPMQLVNFGPYLTGTPRWSPDGRWIAFDSRSNNSGREGNADIYIVSSDGGQPRQLTAEPSEDVAPSWSRDGKWIYFGSTRSGSMQIWKVSAQGGQPVQVTMHGGFEGFESIDGKFFYYSKDRAIPGIWQIPTAGGDETLVFDYHQAGSWRLWRVVEKGVYFATATIPTRPSIEFFNFATRQVTPVAVIDKPLSQSYPGLAVSPDGRSILIAQMDQSGSDIMLMENFR